jgi:hypothetical protein
MNVLGLLMLLVAVVVIIWRLDGHERRRMRCDGCRQEALGSQMPFLWHQCSKGRAIYQDRRGRLYRFGERVRPAAPRSEP